ncbi:MAG: uridine kinase [Myxococcota bacterium]
MEPKDIGSVYADLSLNRADTAYFDDQGADYKIVPFVNVIKIGGQSFMDRGRTAVLPLIDEIVANKPKHKMILGTGGGTRSRHVYSVAMDLGMPTGVIARLGSLVSHQNAKMLHMLMCKHGGIFVLREMFEHIALYLQSGCIPIIEGMPPYEIYERPARGGRIPESRTDTGVYLLGEVLAARSVIFVKDEDGLYTEDPKKNPAAELIPDISLAELQKLDLNDLMVERKVLELMANARHVRQIQLINGLKPGNLTRALDGEHVGTIIHAD